MTVLVSLYQHTPHAPPPHPTAMDLEEVTQIKMKDIAYTTLAKYCEIPDQLEPHEEENQDFELKCDRILQELITGRREVLFKEVPQTLTFIQLKTILNSYTETGLNMPEQNSPKGF